MSSSSDRGPGRPPGYDPDTLELIRRVKDDERKGFSLAETAEREGCSVSYVKLLRRARPEPQPRKPPPLRLTEPKLAHHAVLALRRDTRLRAFDPAKKLFWLDCVMEIHALGDDDGLAFGADGDPFETHAAFAIALAGKPEDLEHFLRRGLLTRLPDGGIDLPSKIGLKPKERPRVMLPGSGEQPLAQRFESAGDGENGDSENPPISLSERTQKPPQFLYPEDTKMDTEMDSETPVARAAAAAANAKESNPLAAAAATESRAGEDTDIRQFHCPPDSEIEDTDISSQRSPVADGKGEPGEGQDRHLAWLAVQLAPEDGVAITPKVLGMIQGWLTEGARIGLDRSATEELILGSVEIQRRRDNFPANPAVEYFRGGVTDALAKAEKELKAAKTLAKPMADG
jgi:hypothetical protein